jgi:hypothetical protein
MKAIWGGGSRFPGHKEEKCGWIMPRIIPLDIPTDSRTDPTSFACLLPDNHTDQSNTLRHDRVITNSDSAFIIIKANKKGGGIGRLIWDKQKTAIAFEVMFYVATDD